jgi:hypothetical protein
MWSRYHISVVIGCSRFEAYPHFYFDTSTPAAPFTGYHVSLLGFRSGAEVAEGTLDHQTFFRGPQSLATL